MPCFKGLNKKTGFPYTKAKGGFKKEVSADMAAV